MTLGLLSQNNLVLVVSGPQNQEAEIIAQLKQQVARFPLQPNKTLVTTSPVAARRTEQAHTEIDASQATLRVMLPAIQATDPDFSPK